MCKRVCEWPHGARASASRHEIPASEDVALALHAFRSRPKNVGEVAYQEEVVSTLTRALESANVG
eukprot:198386-Chlamydomonas_euryale.AAC.2